ncbi:MAG: hypothetical protein KIS78_06135 [Labilithrix sp.]|nr:hypothetical protein [Labilithrix sp.]MCW5832016.1 hypothetical protein [Labilithrix sp.]
MRWLAGATFALLAAAACEETSGLATDGPPPKEITEREAGIDDGAGEGPPDDGGPAPSAARCDPAKPFGPPDLEPALEPTADTVRSAVMSPGELELHYLKYTRTASAGSRWELRRVTRPSREATWSAPTTVDVGEAVAGLSLAAGGLKAYWWTLDSNFVASRSDLDEPFAGAKKFWLASKPQIFVVASNDTAYYAEYVSDGSVVDRIIMRAAMNGSASGLLAGSPVPDLHVNGTSDSQPVLNKDETALYFSSNRPGGKGLADVWVARRGSKLDAFGSPAHLPELSTETVDGVSWVSDDDCVILLERAAHVYIARRPL